MGLIKGTVFFFFADMDVGHSFIQIRKSCIFFFPRKSSSVIQSDFDEVSFFFNKSCLYFFFPNFCVFFCFFSFPRKSSSVIHSFDFFGGKKKKQTGKKKTAFSFIHSKFLKNAKKRTFPGK